MSNWTLKRHPKYGYAAELFGAHVYVKAQGDRYVYQCDLCSWRCYGTKETMDEEKEVCLTHFKLIHREASSPGDGNPSDEAAAAEGAAAWLAEVIADEGDHPDVVTAGDRRLAERILKELKDKNILPKSAD